MRRSMVAAVAVVVISQLALVACKRATSTPPRACEQPVVAIEVLYPGASARDVDLAVVLPLQARLNRLPELAELHSVAEPGRAVFVARTAGDIEELRRLIVHSLAQVDDLPPEVEPPAVWPAGTSRRQRLVAVSGEARHLVLADAASELRRHMIRDADTRRVSLVGEHMREERIEVDISRLSAAGVGLHEFATAVRAALTATALASVDPRDPALIRPLPRGPAARPRVSEIVIKTAENGVPVTVRDVARISSGLGGGVARVDGEPAVLLLVQSTARAGSKNAQSIVQSAVDAVALPAGVKVVDLGELAPVDCCLPAELGVVSEPAPGNVVVRLEMLPSAGAGDALAAVDSWVRTLLADAKIRATVLAVPGWSQGGRTEPGRGEVIILASDASTRVAELLARSYRPPIPGRLTVHGGGQETELVRLNHTNYQQLREGTYQFAHRLEESDPAHGLPAGVQWATSIGNTVASLEARLTPRGRQLGVRPRALATTVHAHQGGVDLGRLGAGRDEQRVIMMAAERDLALLSVPLALSDGRVVPLSTVATLERIESPSRIHRHDLRRVSYLVLTRSGGDLAAAITRAAGDQSVPGMTVELLR